MKILLKSFLQTITLFVGFFIAICLVGYSIALMGAGSILFWIAVYLFIVCWKSYYKANKKNQDVKELDENK